MVAFFPAGRVICDRSERSLNELEDHATFDCGGHPSCPSVSSRTPLSPHLRWATCHRHGSGRTHPRPRSDSQTSIYLYCSRTISSRCQAVGQVCKLPQSSDGWKASLNAAAEYDLSLGSSNDLTIRIVSRVITRQRLFSSNQAIRLRCATGQRLASTWISRVRGLARAAKDVPTTRAIVSSMVAILHHVVIATVRKDRSAPEGHYLWRVPIGSSLTRRSFGFVEESAASRDRPSQLIRESAAVAHEHLIFWIHEMKIYSTVDQELNSDDVMALVSEDANRRRLRLEKAHALQAMTHQLDSAVPRITIPQDVKVVVWQRDHGRCVECGMQTNLEFDHIIPLAMGGSNTMRNLQLLCEGCNRRKGATLG